MTSMLMTHEFVDSIPGDLEPHVLYVSLEFRTTMHLCACGCRNEVVLPIRPTAWTLSYDGVAVSVSPSVGNWSFDCRSHYWIRRGRIEWAGDWSDEEIALGRERTLVDRRAMSVTPPRAEPSKAHRASGPLAFLRALLRR